MALWPCFKNTTGIRKFGEGYKYNTITDVPDL
jgi:hypothetical protein